jgi:hypothetical protein
MRRIGLFLNVALLALLVQSARAGDCGCAAASGYGGDCCSACGCDDCCGGCGGKHCELKIGVKKIKVICYGCECDKVCIPAGPSCKGCTHCENLCGDGCGCGGGDFGGSGCDDCNHKPLCKVRWTDWCPNPCAECRSRKKLVKYEAEKEVPEYKWVVVDCCADAGAPAAPKAKGDDRPPPPPVPTPVGYQTRAKRRMPVKAAPKNAQVGQEYSLTEAEMKTIESQIQQTSFIAPVKPLAKAAVDVAPVVKTSARVARVVTPVADRNAVPWSLFK